MNTGVSRILIIKWSAMGDVVLATACMQDVSTAFPNAEIHLNTTRPWHTLFAHDPRFKHVFTADFGGPARGIGGLLRLAATIRAARYDMVIDLQSNDRSRLLLSLLWASGCAPRVRIGGHRRFPYTAAPPPQARETHALQRLRATLGAAEIAASSDRPVLYPGPKNRARVRAMLEERALVRDRYAVLLPGCQPAGYLKRWGWRNFVAMAILLRDQGVERIVLLGGPDERDECARIREACGDWVVDLCGQTELLDLVLLCEGARYIVSNDTGPGHIASATGRPLAVVCGPTDPRRVRPAGDSVTTLQAPLYCRNCYLKHCTHHSCMTLITPDAVLEKLRAVSAHAETSD